jgi:hypothetical protein
MLCFNQEMPSAPRHEVFNAGIITFSTRAVWGGGGAPRPRGGGGRGPAPLLHLLLPLGGVDEVILAFFLCFFERLFGDGRITRSTLNPPTHLPGPLR